MPVEQVAGLKTLCLSTMSSISIIVVFVIRLVAPPAILERALIDREEMNEMFSDKSVKLK